MNFDVLELSQSLTLAVKVSENLAAVLQNIAATARKAGRNPDEIKLVAVTKTKPVDLIREVVEAGQVDLGENKVQEMVDKLPSFPHAHWHLIGGLQRNKVKYIAPFVHLIHSVDSAELLAEISKRAAANNRIIDCLLQINISDEAQKGGFSEDEAEVLLKNISAYPDIRISGLMGMAAFTEDNVMIRSQFKRLKIARDRFKAFNGPRIQMEELSMGMSGDYEIAIEEGATLVRVGSSIFGNR